MEEGKIIAGLDIGTTKVCVVIGKENEFGKLEVLGMGKANSEGVKRGVVSNIDKTIEAAKKAIKQAEEQAQIDLEVVNVGIAGKDIESSTHKSSLTREATDDEISIKDIRKLHDDIHRLVISPGNKIIHAMPQEYTVDHESGVKDPVGMSGVRLEANFHVITTSNNSAQNIQKCVARNGLEIQQLILEPLASSLAVLVEEEKEAGVCLVDIGGGTTDICIFHDKLIRHTAVLPFGGNIVTKDIKEGCEVSTEQAEELKTKHGKALAQEANQHKVISISGSRNRQPKEIYEKTLSQIIESRMDEIVKLIYAEIIKSGLEKRISCGIVLTGGGAMLKNLEQHVEYTTGMDARIGYPNEHLGKSEIEAVKIPMYATAIGLVLSNFKALDSRESYYQEPSSQRDLPATKQDKNFLSKLVSRVKDLLLDGE